MVKKLPSAALNRIQPTTEEIEKARALLSGTSVDDKKKRKSLNNSMMQWLNKNKDCADNATAAASTAQEREECLVKFFAFQARAKDPTKKVETARTVSKGTEKFVDYFEWGKEKMDQELGPQRAESLRQSGRLNWKPCPFTGSEDEHMKV